MVSVTSKRYSTSLISIVFIFAIVVPTLIVIASGDGAVQAQRLQVKLS